MHTKITKVSVTPQFQRFAKKLHAADKLQVDEAIRTIMSQPEQGTAKKGDLNGVFVYKFKINKQEVLLSYRLKAEDLGEDLGADSVLNELVLLALGSHENYYRDLKNSI